MSEPTIMFCEMWMRIARAEMGQKEFEGVKHNPRILEYHKETTLSAIDDETPWCSSFLNWVFKKSGVCLGTRSAAAKSWALWGTKLEKPQYGCVVVFPNHVGLYLKEIPLFVCVLGGNQKNEVRESWFYKRNILSYRWPLIASNDLPEAS
jgi:uncharacterized protein (TIGR02594 family)